MERYARVAIAACLAGSLALCPQAGLAQGVGIRLAASGDWVAMEQRDSSTGPPYICTAFTRAVGPGHAGLMFGIQANIVDTEIRLSDVRWSLPLNVTGTLALAVGAYRAPLAITDNTSDTAIAAMTEDQLRAMIRAMEKADSMTVTAGFGPKFTVSLRGSNRATDAFQACALHIVGAGKGSGNPFR